MSHPTVAATVCQADLVPGSSKRTEWVRVLNTDPDWCNLQSAREREGEEEPDIHDLAMSELGFTNYDFDDVENHSEEIQQIAERKGRSEIKETVESLTKHF